MRARYGKKGEIEINAEDTAVGFGWGKSEIKNGKTYSSIRWNTINRFSNKLGFDRKLSKDVFIPESLFYKLGMRANSKTAHQFQNWIAEDVIPAINKNGYYIAEEGEAWVEAREKTKESNKERNKRIVHLNRLRAKCPNDFVRFSK